jgi:hypothetical protein
MSGTTLVRLWGSTMCKKVDILRLRPATGVPIFALHQVNDFRIDLSRPVPDTHLDHVDKQKL